MRWEFLFCLCMQTGMMTHMYKVGFLWSNQLDILQRLADALVRAMRLRSKSVHHQYIQSLQQTVFTFGHGKHIRYPRHVADAISQDRELAMHHTDRQDFHFLAFCIADDKRYTRLNFFQQDTGNTGIQTFSKAVRNTFAKTLSHVIFGIHRYIAEAAERTEVVQSTHMVVMLVSDQYGIQWLEIVQTHHLFTEIRSAVYQNPYTIHFDQTRTTQTLVLRVGTCTNWASTTYFGYSSRCSAT